MSFLCDTNVLSELVRPKPNPGVILWSQSLSRLVLSVITLEEVTYGLAWKPNPRIRAWFESFLETSCDVLPTTLEIARRAGELRGTLQARGKTRSQSDMLIAATAQVHALTLVTRNSDDFEGCGIPQLNPFI